MASPNFESCVLNSLVQDAKCLTDGAGFFENDREAADVYLRVLSLKAAGGTDYTVSGIGFQGLLAAAASWIDPALVMTCDQRQAVNLQIEIQNAVYDGITAATDANSLKTNSKQAAALGKEQRRNLLLFLRCQINSLNKPE